ncbi:MAG: hypothetical protein ACI9VT_003148 [Psychroserpens sp.]|jgi:hypothetical protein
MVTSFIILAGIPTTNLFAGISFVTTALAPNKHPSPILTLPNTFTPGAKKTHLPIVGTKFLSPG